jgi:hypothetical protein
MYLVEIIVGKIWEHSFINSSQLSQLPIKSWYEDIEELTIAEAILERVILDAHRIQNKEESLRKNNNLKL